MTAEPIVDTAIEQQTMATLREQFPGVIAITPGNAMRVAGLTKSEKPDLAARQAISRGTFPFPVKKIAGRNMVLLAVIARSMSERPSGV